MGVKAAKPRLLHAEPGLRHAHSRGQDPGDPDPPLRLQAVRGGLLIPVNEPIKHEFVKHELLKHEF
eukprot:362018-Chlamydomonas_euryale.AAC.23